MIRGSEIIGLPVVCLEDGCKNIIIKDILYCNESLKIIAFLVEEGDYFPERKIIKYEHVKNIGKDAIVIENKEVIEEENSINYPNLYRRETLIGIEIITESGNNVGIAKDIMIDKTSGKLMGIVVAGGLLDDLVEGRSILPLQHPLDLNKEIIIISQSLNQSIVHPTGGLKKLLSLE